MTSAPNDVPTTFDALSDEESDTPTGCNTVVVAHSLIMWKECLFASQTVVAVLQEFDNDCIGDSPVNTVVSKIGRL